jgi:hypothetical protein
MFVLLLRCVFSLLPRGRRIRVALCVGRRPASRALKVSRESLFMGSYSSDRDGPVAAGRRRLLRQPQRHFEPNLVAKRAYKK